METTKKTVERILPVIPSTETQPTNSFTQLCVWPAVILGDSSIEEFESFFESELGVRIKYHTEVETLPDLDEKGNPVPDTGGRNDIFFFVHSDDIVKFAVPRLEMGIRWWEDVIKYNDNSKHLYTPEFIEANPVTW
jgi:hypothetical protein